MVKTCSYPEHYFCRENTIFIGKVTDTAVFVGNVADGFDSYAVSGAFGGLENIVFLLYFSIEGILHMDQKEMIMVGINFHINLSAGAVFTLAWMAFSSRLENTRHRLISSMERSAGRETSA